MLVFGNNVVGEALDNAPNINDAYDMDLPEMLSARAFGIHKKAIDDYPDRFEVLNSTFKATFEDPPNGSLHRFKGQPAYLQYAGLEECEAFKQAMLEMGARFKPLLTGA